MRHRLPARAPKESCRLMDAAAKGLASRISSSAAERAVGPSLFRWNNDAITKKVSITKARSTEGLPPVRSA